MILVKEEILRRLSQENPLIENLIDVKLQVQPAGVDLTLKKIFKFKAHGQIDFTNEERNLPETEEIKFKNEWVHLEKGSYLVMFNEIVRIPNDLIMLVRPRSSLIRMGASIHASVWDPGYYGRSVTLLVVYNEDGIRIKKNARIAQAIFIKLSRPTSHLYEGVYKGENI